MIIYIVRHGQTAENLQMILQGHLPGTLTDIQHNPRQKYSKVRSGSRQSTHREIYSQYLLLYAR